MQQLVTLWWCVCHHVKTVAFWHILWAWTCFRDEQKGLAFKKEQEEQFFSGRRHIIWNNSTSIVPIGNCSKMKISFSAFSTGALSAKEKKKWPCYLWKYMLHKACIVLCMPGVNQARWRFQRRELDVLRCSALCWIWMAYALWGNIMSFCVAIEWITLVVFSN